jgi:bacteriocin resistance YdeI/OmpD-like protein
MKTRDWATWFCLLLIASTAGWMIFDGSRALMVGEYVMPVSGEYADQLGPWSNLVQVIGIDPHSLLMKSIFIIQGAAALTVVICYLLNKAWARMGLFVVMVLGLWYLPIGTLTNLIALILLLLTRRIDMPPRPRYEMPDFIHNALQKRGLMEAYLARPPYQRNDYIGWITRARLTATRQKRLKQMLTELKKGDIYMKMRWQKKTTLSNQKD